MEINSLSKKCQNKTQISNFKTYSEVFRKILKYSDRVRVREKFRDRVRDKVRNRDRVSELSFDPNIGLFQPHWPFSTVPDTSDTHHTCAYCSDTLTEPVSFRKH